ncbi:unnamed protein product, partial [Mesorhabditis spiculigera]
MHTNPIVRPRRLKRSASFGGSRGSSRAVERTLTQRLRDVRLDHPYAKPSEAKPSDANDMDWTIHVIEGTLQDPMLSDSPRGQTYPSF